MARVRSIHPGIFTDIAWSKVSPVARWFAVGLTCEADDNGVFVWEPVQLKMRILPVDHIDVEPLLMELEEQSIVRQFSHDGRSFGVLRNFCKFQRPKWRKVLYFMPPELSPFVGLTNGIGEETEVELPIVSPSTESSSPYRGEERSIELSSDSSKTKHTASNEHFETLWAEYPKREGSNPKKPALTAFERHVARGANPLEIINGARRYREHLRARGEEGGRFVAQTVTWLNQERWNDEYGSTKTSEADADRDRRVLLAK